MADDMEHRISTLEAHDKMHTRDIAQLEASIETRIAEVQADVTEIKQSLSKQRGFWAGVTFAASIVGFVLSQIWGQIKGLGQ